MAHTVLQSTAADRTTGVVGAGATSDRQQPSPGVPVAPEPMERSDRPLIGLLGEVVGVAHIAEIPTQPPHVALGLGDEPFQGVAITVASGDEQAGQMIHAVSLTGDLAESLGPKSGTTGSRATTRSSMDCGVARELISSTADGESTAQERALLDAHRSTCASCGAFALDVAVLDRRIRIRSAEPVPDLVADVTARSRPARLGRGGWLRPALAWVAIVMFVQSVPALLFGSASGADTHSARHLGAFGVALAVGFAYAAWKPHRAFGLLPFTAALVATTLLGVVADIVGGARTPVGELIHLSEIIGLTLLWIIAGSPGLSRFGRLTRLHPLE